MICVVRHEAPRIVSPSCLQVYASTTASALATPPPFLPARQLVAFLRVGVISAGTYQRVVLEVPSAALVLTNSTLGRSLLSGQYTLTVSRGYGEVLTAPLAVQVPSA